VSLSRIYREGARLALRDDRRFFRANRDRQFRIRRSKPFELQGWGADPHIRTPLTFVVLRPGGGFDRQPTWAEDGTVIPDEEGPVSAFWSAMQIRKIIAPDLPIKLSEGEAETIFGIGSGRSHEVHP